MTEEQRSHVKREAETEGMWPGAKGHPEPQNWGTQKGPSPEPSEEAQLETARLQTSGLGRHKRVCISVVLSRPVCSNPLQQRRTLTHPPFRLPGRPAPYSRAHGIYMLMTGFYTQHMKKQRYQFADKALSLVKAMVFPVVKNGCERWTIKKAERRMIDAFELWCWRRLLRVPCTARRSNQSILKEISPEYSWEGLTLKLKLRYYGHLMR